MIGMTPRLMLMSGHATTVPNHTIPPTTEIEMRMRSIVVIVAPLFVLVGLVLARVDSTGQTEPSFYQSQIRLPHRTGGSYDLIWPYEGPIAGEKVTLDEAGHRMPFEIPVPGYLPGEAALVEVYASAIDTPREMREAALVYANGIHIIMHYEEMALSYDSSVMEHPDIFKPVEVRGRAGIGADPGLERSCVSYAPSEEWECQDGPGPRPGLVEWQVGGLVIYIRSYDYPLAELLRVAESMDLR
jgi:hypothetical protein